MWEEYQVIGLDINPRAIKVAWINLYLNALNDDGLPVLDHEGKTLLDRVEFYVSDLLAYCREQHLTMDLIVGCIPQVIHFTSLVLCIARGFELCELHIIDVYASPIFISLRFSGILLIVIAAKLFD